MFPLPVFKLGHWFSPALSLCVCVWVCGWVGMCVCSVAQSCLTLVTPMAESCSPPGSSKSQSTGFFQVGILEWVALAFPGDPPDPGVEPASLLSPVLAIRFFTNSATWEAHTQPWSLDYYQLSWLRAVGLDQTCTTGFPQASAYRSQVVAFLSLHNPAS